MTCFRFFLFERYAKNFSMGLKEGSTVGKGLEYSQNWTVIGEEIVKQSPQLESAPDPRNESIESGVYTSFEPTLLRRLNRGTTILKHFHGFSKQSKKEPFIIPSDIAAVA